MPRIIGINYQIPSSSIADGAVTNPKIAMGAVSDQKRSFGSVALTGSSPYSADWSVGDNFYQTSNNGLNKTINFSNIIEGKTVIVTITNNSASATVITFPTSKTPLGYSTSVPANTTTVFTFVRSNGVLYATSVNMP